MRIAEEQPVLPFRPFRRALLHKGAERRNPGSRANHDNRGLRVSRQTEVVIVFDKDAHFAIFFHAVGEVTGRAAGASAAFDVITHDANGNVDFVFRFRL